MRGSGGVGILVKEYHLSKLADSDPPVDSSQDVDVAERLLL